MQTRKTPDTSTFVKIVIADFLHIIHQINMCNKDVHVCDSYGEADGSFWQVHLSGLTHSHVQIGLSEKLLQKKKVK